MKNNKKKYALLIFLMLLIAFFSSQCMMTRTNMKSKKTIAIILPSSYNKSSSRILDAMHDYAYNNSITLDVWYKGSISSEELDSLIKKEEQNHAIGILLIYPEKYLTEKNKHYNYNNLLAITDTMKSSFSCYASFKKTIEPAYPLPISPKKIQQIEEGILPYIYIKNTYKLGYESINTIALSHQTNHMKNILISCTKLDKSVLESGKLDSLLAN